MEEMTPQISTASAGLLSCNLLRKAAGLCPVCTVKLILIYGNPSLGFLGIKVLRSGMPGPSSRTVLGQYSVPKAAQAGCSPQRHGRDSSNSSELSSQIVVVKRCANGRQHGHSFLTEDALQGDPYTTLFTPHSNMKRMCFFVIPPPTIYKFI